MTKVCIHGWSQYHCGKGWLSNGFDATVTFIDTAQLFFLVGSRGGNSLPFNASIFRVVRLLRLARILRLLRSRVFVDLVSMIQGLIGGLWTLLWAVILFVVFVYITALIFRELLGKRE